MIDIDVTPEQLDDRFDEALQFYQEYHADAVVKTYFKHNIVTEDFTNGYVTIPEPLFSVTRIFNTGGSMGSDMFNAEYQMHMNDLGGLMNGSEGGSALISYEMSRQYMATVDLLTTGMSNRLSFSRHKNQIALDDDVKQSISVGDWIVIEGYTTLDPQTYTDVYNDLALKRYMTALIKRQWGSNLMKFEGMQLPGGVTFNGRQIYDDAKEEIREMEETFQLKYEDPVSFFVG